MRTSWPGLGFNRKCQQVSRAAARKTIRNSPLLSRPCPIRHRPKASGATPPRNAHRFHSQIGCDDTLAQAEGESHEFLSIRFKVLGAPALRHPGAESNSRRRRTRLRAGIRARNPHGNPCGASRRHASRRRNQEVPGGFVPQPSQGLHQPRCHLPCGDEPVAARPHHLQPRRAEPGGLRQLLCLYHHRTPQDHAQCANRRQRSSLRAVVRLEPVRILPAGVAHKVRQCLRRRQYCRRPQGL